MAPCPKVRRRLLLQGGLGALPLGCAHHETKEQPRTVDPGWGGAAGAAGETGGGGHGGDPSGDRPLNVIWISADDLGIRLGAYGDQLAVTPQIDAFAKRAMTFEKAYCQVAICAASRTSIFTGVRPSTSGLVGLNHDWKASLPEVTSLPRFLRDQGYLTHGIGKLLDSRSGPGDDPYDIAQIDGRFHDERVALDALEERAQGEGPFFLGIGFSAPHCPLHPSDESHQLHDARIDEMPGRGRTLHAESEQKCLEVGGLKLSEEEARDVTVRYYATITDLDKKVGRILAKIDELGLFETSIVLFWCGDHGYHLGESDHIGKLSNYVYSTQIPLIMHVPGRTQAGERSARLVECVDMYPTLVDLLGLDPPDHELDGASFAPLMDAPTRKWKAAAFTLWREDLSVKTEEYNFIAYKNGERALFDLRSDPFEYTNIAEQQPQQVAEMERLLEAGWRPIRKEITED